MANSEDDKNHIDALNPSVNRDRPKMPVRYHCGVDEAFAGWAQSCGWRAGELRPATEQAVLDRHPHGHEEYETHMPGNPRPTIFQLWIDRTQVFYSVEDTIVIRGYGWEVEGEPSDDFDGGGFYL